MLRFITVVTTVLFPTVIAEKYDFGYIECTYNTYKFRCLGRDVVKHERERYGLVEFPDIGNGITCLKLKSNKIEYFPKVLSNYKSVVSLDLSKNSIKELPVNLKDMSSLEILDLSDNGISTLSSGTKFPPSLRGLLLGDNLFTSLPPLQIPGLFVLDLSGNRFKEIPSTFCVSKELIRADFTKNPLAGDTSRYVGTINSCKNRNDVRFCLFVDKPEIKCNCDSMVPMIGFDPNFCLGSLERGKKFRCNTQSFEQYVYEMVYDIKRENVSSTCNLADALESESHRPLSSFGMIFSLVIVFIVY